MVIEACKGLARAVKRLELAARRLRHYSPDVTSGVCGPAVGPSVLRCAALCCAVQADTLDDAIALVNGNPYGNGTAIFTDSGSAARRFQHDVQVCVPDFDGVGDWMCG